MGHGHAIRMLACAQAVIDRGGAVLLCSAQLPSSVREQYLAEGAEVHVIEAEAGSQQDATALHREAAAFHAGWIVVDGYQFHSSYFETLRAEGHRVLCMDDTGAAAPYAVDIILNQNVHASEVLYTSSRPDATLLLGPDYALLRRAFLAAPVSDRAPVAHPARLLITLGGSDPANITARVVQMLCRDAGALPDVHVLLGSGYMHDTGWIQSASNAGLNLTVHRDHHDVALLMRGMDVAVSAAGSTLLELAYLGVPTVALITAENQREAARAIDARGAAMLVTPDDGANVIDALRLVLSDSRVREKIARQARALVDGLGTQRVLDMLTTMM